VFGPAVASSISSSLTTSVAYFVPVWGPVAVRTAHRSRFPALLGGLSAELAAAVRELRILQEYAVIQGSR